MTRNLGSGRDSDTVEESPRAGSAEAPGKRTRTGSLPVQRKSDHRGDVAAGAAAPVDGGADDPFAFHLPVQYKAEGGATPERGELAAGAIAGKGAGAALPSAVQDHFGASYGTDLSAVRVHDDPAANRAVEQSGAKAFAHGTDLFFGGGQYDPGSASGQFLIGHELAHVAQQGARPAAAPTARPKAVGGSRDADEQQADAAAHTALETGQTGDVHEVEASAAASAALAGQRSALSSAPPRVRFFAQDEGPNAGGGGHALLTENALRGMGGLNAAEVRQARMGNWERDLSQLLIPTSVSLGLTGPDRPIMRVLNVIAISDFHRGINLQSFGTYDPVEHIDNPTGLRGSDVIDQGGAAGGMPAAHADGANPDNAASISGPNATAHAAGTDHQAYAELDDRYQHNTHIDAGGHSVANPHDATAFQIDESAIPNYMYTSRDWTTQTLRNAARLGTQRNLHNPDGTPSEEALHGPRMFSSGVHTLQDYYAHSNFCEVAINVLIRAGGLRVATQTEQARDPANHPVTRATQTQDLGQVAGTTGRVLNTQAHANDAAGNPGAANLSVGNREAITTGSFNLTDTIDSLSEEISAKWRALDPFRVKPDVPSPIMLAAMDYIEMDPNNAANFGTYAQQMADLIHPAVATIGALGSAGAAVTQGAGSVASHAVEGVASVGSGLLDGLAMGADFLQSHTGHGGGAAATLHGGAAQVAGGGHQAAGAIDQAAGATADGIRNLVTQLNGLESQLRSRQHNLRDLYAWAYAHGPLDLLKAAARGIPMAGPAAAGAIESVQQHIHALIEGALGALWNVALDHGTATINEFIGVLRERTNVQRNRRPVAPGALAGVRQTLADKLGNVSEFYDQSTGRPRVTSGGAGGAGEHYTGIAPGSYTPPSHSEIAKDHGDIENRPGEAHADAGGGHVEQGSWLNGLAMALAQLATSGVAVPVNACWAVVDGGRPLAATDPMLDAINVQVNRFFDHPAANQAFWEATVRSFVGGELGPQLVAHLRDSVGSAPVAPGPIHEIPPTHPANAGPRHP